MCNLVTALSIIILLLGICLIVYDHHFDKHIKEIRPFEKITKPITSPVKSDSIVEVYLNGNEKQKYRISLFKIITIYQGLKASTFNENPPNQEVTINGNETCFFQLNTNTRYSLQVHPYQNDDLIPIPDAEYRIIEYKQPNDKIFIMGSTLIGIGIGILIQGQS